jgi:hypothetical protein
MIFTRLVMLHHQESHHTAQVSSANLLCYAFKLPLAVLPLHALEGTQQYKTRYNQ